MRSLGSDGTLSQRDGAALCGADTPAVALGVEGFSPSSDSLDIFLGEPGRNRAAAPRSYNPLFRTGSLSGRHSAHCKVDTDEVEGE